MHVISTKQPRASFLVRWMVVLCLALVALLAVEQAVHYHADLADAVQKHCPLCQALHGTAAVTHSVQIAFSCQTTAYLPVSLNSADTSSSASFALFSRPPPLA